MVPQFEVGGYNVRIHDAGIETSKNKGTPGVTLKVEIRSKIEEGEDGTRFDAACDPGFRTINLWITEKTVDFTIDKLRKAGWEGQSFDELHQLVGMQAAAFCRHETQETGEYAGQTQEKWDLGLPTSQNVNHDSTTARKLNALFGKKLKMTKPAGNQQSAPAPQRQSVPAKQAPPEYGGGNNNDDDSIPF